MAAVASTDLGAVSAPFMTSLRAFWGVRDVETVVKLLSEKSILQNLTANHCSQQPQHNPGFSCKISL